MRYSTEERASQNIEYLGYAFRSTHAARNRGTIREIGVNCRNSCTWAKMADVLILEQDLSRNVHCRRILTEGKEESESSAQITFSHTEKKSVLAGLTWPFGE